nr:nucleotide-binding alpha-beta plait domain-containing protein [Tanacetum cinerariifolium]
GFITTRRGSFRSKEDDVSKISTSIFVTNFPENFSAKDLFHSCKVYEHVVDSFIPVKKTNSGVLQEGNEFINVDSIPINDNSHYRHVCQIYGRINYAFDFFNKVKDNLLTLTVESYRSSGKKKRTVCSWGFISEPLETSKTRVTSSPSPTPPSDPTSPPSSSEVTTCLGIAHTYTSTTILLPLYCADGRAYTTTLSLSYSAKLTEAMTLSPYLFCTYEPRVDKETDSTESGDEDPTWRMRRLHQRVSVKTLPSSVWTPTTPEWSLESPPILPVIHSPVASSAPSLALDEDDLLEIRE